MRRRSNVKKHTVSATLKLFINVKGLGKHK
jgi:hypothetical protein